MNPMHQPTEVKRTFHSLTIDGSDVDITRFYEFIKSRWLIEHSTFLNFENAEWDNGHDVLRFETKSTQINLIKYIQKLSSMYPHLFIMYDYYTDEDEENFEEAVFWLYGGKINTNREELSKEF